MVAAYLVGALVGALFAGRWWWVVASCAAATVYLWPQRAASVTTSPAEGPSPDKTTAQALQWLQNVAMGKLPASARDVLADIIQRAQELMPRLKEMEQAGMVQAPNRVALKQMVKVFLPQAIENYNSLPAVYARTHKGADGLTAEDLLLNQMRLMAQHLQQLQEQAYAESVDALLAQSHFLNERFDAARASQLALTKPSNGAVPEFMR